MSVLKLHIQKHKQVDNIKVINLNMEKKNIFLNN